MVYNLTKEGVDTNVKLCASCHVGRRTQRSAVVIFSYLMNFCAVHSFVITNSNFACTDAEVNFLKALAKANDLVRPLQVERCNAHIPRAIHQNLVTQLSIEERPGEAPPAERDKTAE